MSKDVLLQAAHRMRHEWQGSMREDFYSALADMLCEVAIRWDYVEERELAFAVACAYLDSDA